MSVLSQKLNSVSMCYASNSAGTTGVSLGVKRTGREADYSLKVPRLRVDGVVPLHIYAISLICDKNITTQNLAFLSYWYISVSQPLSDRGPVNSFFIRRGPGPNKFTRKYLSKFF